MSSPTILLAEDDARVLSSLKRILYEQGGLAVTTATNGVEAWERALEIVPDLIVSDYQMPGMNGFELCQQVKAEPSLAGCLFVVLTAFTDTALKVEGLNLGVDDYLTKPVEAPEFLAKIRATLRIKDLHDELRSDKEELERLHKRLNTSFDNLLSVLINLVDLRIPGSAARGEWLADKSVAVAVDLQVPSVYLADLEIAAKLHEIGRLVEQPESDDQVGHWHYLVASQAVLEDVDSLSGAAELIGAVGEHWDGTGGPGRLIRGQVPLRSRILRVMIDFSSAWWVDSQIGGAPTIGNILTDLERYSGTRYDPKVVNQLRKTVTAGGGTDWLPTKHRVPLRTLADGMVLAEDLCTSSGIKLLAKGSTITEQTLELILRRHTSDPVLYGAWIET
jgi:response regulator RpfG family c-di-GMP phosphodiesterase